MTPTRRGEGSGTHRRRLAATWLWPVAMALLVGAPWLAPGYILNLDMVFTPHQSLQPWMFGTGGGLPRAVPQDVVVGVLAGPLPGALVQRAALFAALILAGAGAARLMTSTSTAAALVASTVYVWNPFVAERLGMGNWALLLTYAAAPWLWSAALALRAGDRKGPQFLLWSALGSLVPTGGVVVMATSVVLLLPRARSPLARRAGVVFGAVGLSLPWLVATVLHGNPGAADPAGAIFGLRSDGPWGDVLTALSLGGSWNGDVVPTSRTWGLGLVWLAAAAVACWYGASRLRRVLTGAAWIYLSALSVAGLALALASATTLGARAMAAIPGGGLARDGQKPLLFLSLWVSLAAALGVARLLEKSPSAHVRTTVATLAVAAPLMLLPDLAWGVAGQLTPVRYPADWNAMRAAVGASQSGAVSLPWSTLRRYGWNRNRSVVDPLPRYVDRTVVTDTSLLVGHGVGTNRRLERVGGDDPTSAAVWAALQTGAPLDAALPPLGIDLVVVQTDQPTPGPTPNLDGMQRTWLGPGFELWQTTHPARTIDRHVPVPLTLAYLAALATLAGAAITPLAARLGARSARTPPER